MTLGPSLPADWVADTPAGHSPQYYNPFGPGRGSGNEYGDGSGGGFFQFEDASRWSRTATNGSGLQQGDPTTLTWSIVPDGTPIPGFNGEPALDSDLIARLDDIYNEAPTTPLVDKIWFELFENVFASWSDETGLDFVYEPNDDGVTFSNSNRGIVGTRADIRLGGHPIDGNNSVLAYNFFPNFGEMIIDTDDSFYETLSGNSVRLRNVSAHELGHGLGLEHVCPTDKTKLMEPFYTSNFDGPQHDDILAGNRAYGDPFEFPRGNDTVGKASDVGLLAIGDHIIEKASIDDVADIDYFRFSVGAPTEIDVTLRPIGWLYQSGPQVGGSCGSGSDFNSKEQSDLAFEIWTEDGRRKLGEANSQGLGQNEVLTDVALPAAGEYLLKITGADPAAQLYEIDLHVASNDSPVAGLVDFDARLFEIGKTVSVTVRDTDLIGTGSVAVTMTTEAGDSESVALAEVGGGVFTGTVPLGTSAGLTSDNGTLEANPGDNLTVNYLDADDGSGNPQSTTDHALVFRETCSPEDAFDYSACTIFPQFQDIRDTGTEILRNTDNSNITLSDVDLGDFAFSFYGTTYSSLNVNTNGLLTFSGSPGSAANNSDLTTSPSQATIAAFWTDLRTDGFADEVYWQVLGTGDNEQLVIQWNDVVFDDGDNDGVDDRGNGVTFQVILSENDDSIQVNHLDVGGGTNVDASEGAIATVGIKDSGNQGDGTNRLLLSLNEGPNDFVGSHQSFRISRHPTLQLTIDASSVREDDGTGATTATVTRTRADNSVALTVDLSSSDTSEATAPATVTIPADQLSVTFPVNAVDDNLLDGTQTVTIAASAAGLVPSARDIDVTDHETVTLVVSDAQIAENAGGAATVVTITRSNTDNDSELLVSLDSNDTSEATVPTSATIPSGQASVTVDVDAVDDALLDGTQTVIISGAADGYFGVNETLDVLDHETVVLTISAPAISERDGTAATTAMVQRSNTDNSADLVVTLASSDTSEATVPSSVTIPGGLTSVAFDIDAVDDNLLDGTQTVFINPSASGYQPDADSLAVTDYETLTITVSPAAMAENAGSAAATATITRSNTDNSVALTVDLQSSDTTEATVPASVTIPASAASTTFPIDAVDDDLLDGSQGVIIAGSNAAYASVNDTIEVTDYEVLSVVILADSVYESAGEVATTAAVTRGNTDIGDAITVFLAASDTTEASVPASVTIPAGQPSATFDIHAVDDLLLDGPQTVQVTASNTAYQSGSDSLIVLDDETLSITFADLEIAENEGVAATTATVTRPNLDNAQALVVTLTNEDSTEVAVPASVTIPANQDSVSFSVDAVDDQLLDGTQRVTIVVSAAGFFDGAASLDVTDFETLIIVAEQSRFPENAGTAATTATITRSNSDNAEPLIVSLSSSDTSELTLPKSVTIPSGQPSATVPIDAVDDNLLDGTQTVLLSATGSGYAAVSDTVAVDDFETVTVTIAADSFYEDVGSAATAARIERSNTDDGQALQVQLSSDDETEATVPASVTIPAGQASVEVDIDAVDDDVLDGTQTVIIAAAATGYVGLSDSVDVLDREGLSLDLSASQIREDQGPSATTATVARPPGGSQAALMVTLTNGDSSEIAIPATVTIPDGQDSVTFAIDAVDDTLLDGTQSVSIEAAASGFAPALQSIDVLDFETVSISLDDAQIAENAGVAATTATITRSNSDISNSLTVQLVNHDPSEVAVPASVTIPANSHSVTVPVDAVDDQWLDGTQLVHLVPQAAGYDELAATLSVTDYETLTVTIAAGHISEADGPAATTATVSRSNTDNALALIVDVSSSDTTEATAAATVTIPAGEGSTTFDIDAVDDNILDGSQSVTFLAVANGYETVSDSLIVRDYETLSLAFDVTTFAENDASDVATATVTRNNADIDGALLVSIFNNDLSEVDVPTSVVIPANQTSATFPVHAVDDDLLDGTQSVTIQAATEGYILSQQTLTVTDYETLTVEIAAPSVREDQGQAATTVTVTRSNTDNEAPLEISLASSDTTEAVVPALTTFPANASSVTVDLDAVDDQQLDGSQFVDITAAASGYVTILDVVEVKDYETLTVQLDDDRIAENDGAGATFATVTRSNIDSDGDLVLMLTSSDTSEATVPGSVTIPADQPSITFPVNAVDDTLRDGLQTLTITAQATGYSGVADTLLVTDYETITVQLDRPEIAENDGAAAASLSVTRSNTDNATALLVLLSSSDTTEASIIDRVVIPASEASITVAVDAVDDATLDGTQTAVLAGAAEGYFAISDSLQVMDHETLLVEIGAESIAENAGAAATTATVTRSNVDDTQAFTLDLSSSDTSEATVPASITIPQNQTSATAPVDAIDDALLDGTQTATIVVSAVGFLSGSMDVDVLDYETITLTVSATHVREDAGPAALTGRVTRSNSDNGEAIQVTLTSDDSTEATVPASVTIPANESFVDFAIDAVDDDLLDGEQAVVLSAQLAGYQPVDASVSVLDAEALTVFFADSHVAENAGAAATELTVTRSNTDTSSPLTVTLTNEDATELSVPATIVIPGGQSAVTVPVDAVDDALLDGIQPVIVSAAAGGYDGAAAQIDVTDHETLLLELDSTIVNEADGIAATTATLTRSNTDVTADLTVTLGNSDLSEIAIPATLTIPAGQNSASLAIEAVDDALLDGSQLVTISAAATGYVGDARQITVEDYETVSLSMDLATILESDGPEAATVTVTRSNLDNDSPLLVTLSNSDLTELAIPETVTIPAGAASIEFAVAAVDDTLLDGTQTVTVMAAETRYASDRLDIDVLDHEVLTLVFDRTEVSENEGLAVAVGTVTRGNTDIQASLTVMISSSDSTELVAPETVVIPADQASATFTVDAVDDTLLDGTQDVLLTISADGYFGDEQNLKVNDHETLGIAVAPESVAENDGTAAAVATITRSNTDIDHDLIVVISSSDETELITAATVTIPSSQSSVELALDAVDDSLLDGTQQVFVSVATAGYEGSSQSVDVTDHETLLLDVDVLSFREDAGISAATATLTRSNTDNAQDLVVELQSSDPSELQLPTTVTIPANLSSVTFPMDALDDTLLDGTQSVLIAANSPGYVNGQQSLDVLDHETLTLEIDRSRVTENAGLDAATATVTRSNSDWDLPLTVRLTNADASEVDIPTEVTILSGQAAATFAIHSVDDSLLDGLQTVAISAESNGYFGDQRTMEIEDYETLTLTLDVTEVNESDGAAVSTATVERGNTDVDQPLVVQLSGDDTEIGIPATVTIPAATSSVQFELDAVDDDLLDGTQSVVIQPLARGYVTLGDVIDVTDYESISISIVDSVLSESDGIDARTVTITRSNSDISQPLSVALISDDESEIEVPETAVIPAAQSSVDVPLNAMDDLLLDGPQQVSVTVEAAGYVNDQLSLTVLDYETVTISFVDNIIEELDGIAATTGTVSRSNLDNDSQLVVQLQGVDPTEVMMPSEITIPAGQASATFSVDAIDDQMIDGVQTMTITASASGYVAGSTELEVLDNAFPWQNSRNPLDVDNDGVIAPIDVLIVINYLNLIQGSGQLPAPPAAPPPFYDTSGDNVAAPIDALLVINYLNNVNGGGEGEASSVKAGTTCAQAADKHRAGPAQDAGCPAPGGADSQPWRVGPTVGQAERTASQSNWEQLLHLLAADTAEARRSLAEEDSGDDVSD